MNLCFTFHKGVLSSVADGATVPRVWASCGMVSTDV